MSQFHVEIDLLKARLRVHKQLFLIFEFRYCHRKFDWNLSHIGIYVAVEQLLHLN